MRGGCTLVRTNVFLIGKAVSRKGRTCRWLTQRMSGLLEAYPHASSLMSLSAGPMKEIRMGRPSEVKPAGTVNSGQPIKLVIPRPKLPNSPRELRLGASPIFWIGLVWVGQTITSKHYARGSDHAKSHSPKICKRRGDKILWSCWRKP
jgi:hypothetical protein